MHPPERMQEPPHAKRRSGQGIEELFSQLLLCRVLGDQRHLRMPSKRSSDDRFPVRAQLSKNIANIGDSIRGQISSSPLFGFRNNYRP